MTAHDTSDPWCANWTGTMVEQRREVGQTSGCPVCTVGPQEGLPAATEHGQTCSRCTRAASGDGYLRPDLCTGCYVALALSQRQTS